MMSSPTQPTRPLPGWLMTVCSAVAVLHLSLIGVFALSASSGPWPVPAPFGGGESMVDGPVFAARITADFTIPYYLMPLRMTHNYHFQTNRPAPIAVYFEAHLKDEAGKVTVLKFPDEKAVWWVRHRQEVLAQNLAQDRRRPPVGTQPVALPGELPKFEVWEPVGPLKRELKTVTDLDLDPKQPYDQPNSWTKAVSQSYARYLMREHNAVSVELVRCTRPSVNPTLMQMTISLREEEVKGFFTEMKYHFGEYRRE
jgi:hypothetical protein